MSHKTSSARRTAFLRAVAETGNQTIACERAKVSRSWVQLHRSTDPQFDAEVRAAIEVAKARLRPAEGQRPPAGWGFLDGEELVVRGTNGRRVQIARARLHQWTPRAEDRFLATLAATCNVDAACAEVGLSPASAYEHRKRWPAFGERWDDAIEAGSRRLDGGLTAGAIALLDPERVPIEPVIAPMSVDDAIRLVRLHERRVREAWQRHRGSARGCGPKWPGVAGKRSASEVRGQSV